jgi:hypothetical protein
MARSCLHMKPRIRSSVRCSVRHHRPRSIARTPWPLGLRDRAELRVRVQHVRAWPAAGGAVVLSRAPMRTPDELEAILTDIARRFAHGVLEAVCAASVGRGARGGARATLPASSARTTPAPEEGDGALLGPPEHRRARGGGARCRRRRDPGGGVAGGARLHAARLRLRLAASGGGRRGASGGREAGTLRRVLSRPPRRQAPTTFSDRASPPPEHPSWA